MLLPLRPRPLLMALLGLERQQLLLLSLLQSVLLELSAATAVAAEGMGLARLSPKPIRANVQSQRPVEE